MEPVGARDVRLRLDRDGVVVRVEELEVAHRELADATAARRVVRRLGELPDAEEKKKPSRQASWNTSSSQPWSGSEAMR